MASHAPTRSKVCDSDCGPSWRPGFCDPDCPNAPGRPRPRSVLIVRFLTRWKRRLRIDGFAPELNKARRCRLCLGYSSQAPEPDGGCYDCPRRTL